MIIVEMQIFIYDYRRNANILKQTHTEWWPFVSLRSPGLMSSRWVADGPEGAKAKANSNSNSNSNSQNKGKERRKQTKQKQ